MLQESVNFWVSKYPYLKTYFEDRLITGLLQLCNSITEPEKERDKLTNNFVTGLVGLVILSKSTNKEALQEIDNLLNPVFQLVIEYATYSDFQTSLINKEITGEDVLMVKDVQIPITSNAIILHINRINVKPLSASDIQHVIKDFLEYKRKFYVESKVLQDKSLTLAKIFKEVSKYKKIINILIERGFCEPGTNSWKDENNGSKGFLVSIIKYLHHLGYYDYKPTNEDIHYICLNTFHINISIDTIKKNKSSKAYNLNFLPLSSSI